MKIRVVLAADEGKILTNGTEKEHMVYADSVDNMPDVSMWREVDATESSL